MARTIEEIQEVILAEKEKIPELSGLTSASKVSIWMLFVYIVSYAIFSLELLFDKHNNEVSERLVELKPHTARWYRNKALAFQYGFDLREDSDRFNNEGYTDEQIENSQIVKYSAVIEAQSESRLIIKIATETNDKLSPVPAVAIEAFTEYMEEIKDAGVPLTIINYLPDLLYLGIKIKRDPLVLDASGTAIEPINGDISPVLTTIQNLLRELPFNGELHLSRLTDKLQLTRGVRDIEIINAATAWVSPDTGGYGNAQAVDMSVIPESGYFTTESPNNQSLINITYVV